MSKASWIKTDEQVEFLKKSGAICAQILKEVLLHVKPQVSCAELDRIASEQMQRHKVSPSFATVDSYKWVICTTVNEQVVHGVPTNYLLKEGDILGIDIGVIYKGYHSDMALTVPVGKISEERRKFLQTGRQTLNDAIKAAKVGNSIGDISATIEKGVKRSGYSIVRELSGHGVGKDLHEDPPVPGFGQRGAGPKLLANTVLAIEVIYTQGSGEVKLEDDGWTITSADVTLGGLFEQTIAITKNGPIMLTPYL